MAVTDVTRKKLHVCLFYPCFTKTISLLIKTDRAESREQVGLSVSLPMCVFVVEGGTCMDCVNCTLCPNGERNDYRLMIMY